MHFGTYVPRSTCVILLKSTEGLLMPVQSAVIVPKFIFWVAMAVVTQEAMLLISMLLLMVSRRLLMLVVSALLTKAPPTPLVAAESDSVNALANSEVRAEFCDVSCAHVKLLLMVAPCEILLKFKLHPFVAISLNVMDWFEAVELEQLDELLDKTLLTALLTRVVADVTLDC